MSPPNQYVVGMVGQAEALIWTVPAPTGVNFTLTTTRQLVATFERPGAELLTISTWSISNVTASSLVATYVPDGSEFPEQGPMTVRKHLVLDGVTYRYQPETEHIFPE